MAEHLGHRAIEHFLPQFESVRRWKDRRVRLQLPLFPGYVFVRIDFTHRLRVLQVPHVVRIVGFDGSPMPVPDEELIRIRALMASGCEAKPYPYLRVGRRVRVASGPFEGLEGIVVRRKNGMRLVISLEIIQRSIAVELSELELAPAASDFSGSSPLSRAHG